jgi:hypothetical protein
MLERRGGTYSLIIEDSGSDQSAFIVLEQRGGTYKLSIEDGGSDRSVFSMLELHGGTYELIVEDRGSDWCGPPSTCLSYYSAICITLKLFVRV